MSLENGWSSEGVLMIKRYLSRVFSASACRMLAAPFLLSQLLLAGCAMNHRVDYSQVVAKLKAKPQGKVSVAVITHDQRPDVVSGVESPRYAGVTIGRDGARFGVNTESGLPIAADMTAATCRSLKASGFGCIGVSVQPKATETSVVGRVAQTKAQRGLVLVLKEWQTATRFDTELSCHLIVRVVDGSGKVLAEAGTRGNERIKTHYWNGRLIGFQSPEAFQRRLEALLNRPEIVDALNVGATAVDLEKKPSAQLDDPSLATTSL
jgi:hypothetical protein